MTAALVLEAAESALVSCRFAEASSMCREHLEVSAQNGPVPPDKKKTHQQPAAAAASPPALRLGDLPVAVAEPREVDRLTAVLLQCGFELGRKDEYRFCHSYYRSQGPMPLAIALLWLKLRVEEGEGEFAGQALADMRAALRGESSLAHAYAQVSEMLVADVLLPAGDCAGARRVLSEDAVTSHMDHETLAAMRAAARDALSPPAAANGSASASRGAAAAGTADAGERWLSTEESGGGDMLLSNLPWEARAAVCAAVAVGAALAAYRGRGTLAKAWSGVRGAAVHVARFALGED